MAQNVTIAGNQYPSVPSILIPKTGGGGNATFTDTSPTTASASDVAQGKIFFDSTGTQQTGTASGGGEDRSAEIIERTISGIYSNSNVSIIGSYAFAYCSSITGVDLTSATKIGSSAFLSCSRLTTVNIPLANSIGSYAFMYCSSLSSASFSLVKSIYSSAFMNCTSLSFISFPIASSVAPYAFNSCPLSTVSFPSLSYCGSYAFGNCRSLQSVYLLNSYVAIGANNMFSSTPMINSTYLGHFGSIYVRSSLLSSWATKTYWSAYSARMVGLTDAQIAALG